MISRNIAEQCSHRSCNSPDGIEGISNDTLRQYRRTVGTCPVRAMSCLHRPARRLLLHLRGVEARAGRRVNAP